MAFSVARRAVSARAAHATLRLPAALVVVGTLGIGIGGTLLLTTAAFLAGGAVLLGGIALAGIGGNWLWRSWTAINRALTTITQVEDITLLPVAAPAADSPLAPVLATLGQMGQAVRHLVGQLQMQADQVGNIAQHIGQAADQQNQQTITQEVAIGQVARQLDAIIARVTATAREVSQAAEQVHQASTNSQTVVAQAVDSLDITRLRVGETLAAIDALRSRAGEIGVIGDLIADVAGQTHILALNGAIEAAGAGAAGRRFGVIVTEVRSLAGRMQQEALQVGPLVAELQQAVALAVAAATAGLDQTAHTTGLATTLTATVGQLDTTATRTQQLAVSIDQAMVEQRASAAEVAQGLGAIAESAQGQRRQTTALATEAGDLIEVARQLRGSALRFGVRTAAGRLRLLIAGRETVSSRGRAWHALVDAWNREHPATTIALEFIPPNAEYLPDLGRALAGGTAPDIMHVINGSAFVRQGYLAPLDDLLSPAVHDDFYPALLDVSRYEGRLYSLPTEAQPLLILYNRRLFAQLGVPVPRTWEALIDAARRCRTPQRWGLIMETTPGEYRAKQWLPFVWQGGGEVLDAAGQVRLDTPAVQAALQLWRDLIVTHRVAPLKRPHPFYDIANLVEGHCAMQYIGSWGLVMLRESYPDFEYGIMAVPTAPGGQPRSILLRWGLAVNAHSPQREAAKAFVRWALAGEGAAGAARARSLLVEGLPVRRSIVPIVEGEGGADPAWHFMLEQIYPHGRPDPEWLEPTRTAWDQAYDQVIADFQP
ncbi:MAG TPA: extracellular solute-binding protein [Chloroflexia bacterium]|nr:extracellular solute-binding protein [Chloroflexia bacterium]